MGRRMTVVFQGVGSRVLRERAERGVYVSKTGLLLVFLFVVTKPLLSYNSYCIPCVLAIVYRQKRVLDRLSKKAYGKSGTRWKMVVVRIVRVRAQYTTRICLLVRAKALLPAPCLQRLLRTDCQPLTHLLINNGDEKCMHLSSSPRVSQCAIVPSPSLRPRPKKLNGH